MAKNTNTIFNKRTHVIVIITMLLFLSIAPSIQGINNSFAATTAVLEEKWHGSYANWQFKFKGYNGYGLCAYDSKKSADVGASGTVSDVTNNNVIKIVYYVMYKKSGAGLSKMEMRYSHVYISYKVNGKKSLTDTALKYLDDALEWAKQYEAMDMPPEYEQFKVYEWTPTGNSKDRQSVVFFSYVKPGSISLIKKSSDNKAMSTGMYSMIGTEYTIYKSDRKTVVDKLIVYNEDGETNTVMASPGTYYVRETMTPTGSGFQINDAWLTAEVKSGNHVELQTEGTAAEVPIPGKVYIRKHVEDDDPVTTKFEFELINVNDNSIRYSLAVGPDSGLVSETIEILAGTYIVTEHFAEGYESKTEPFEITVKPGETKEIEWTNRMLNENKLKVIKENLDGLSTKGFKFKLSGVLFKRIVENGETKYITERKLTEESAIEKAGLGNDSLTFDSEIYPENKLSVGKWSINKKDLNAINEAAASGKTGEYQLSFTNEIQNGEDNITIEVKSIVSLKQMLQNQGSNAGRSVKEGTPVQAVEEIYEGIKANYNKSIEFAAAKTEYLDSETGKNYTEIVLGDNDNSEINVPFGRYTVSEDMTSSQSARYHDEEGKSFYYAGEKRTVILSQTRDVTAESKSGDYTFSFENIPRTASAALMKTTDKGEPEGVSFNLKSVGKNASGEEYENNFVTDDNGYINFGSLYAGTYILQEQSFDSNKWINTYPLEGYSAPAIKFTITGNENGTVWIGGEPGNGHTETGDNENPKVYFHNKHYTDLFISKVDSDTRLFLPGVKFEIHDEDDNTVVKFTLIRNDDGIADIDISYAADGITGGSSIGEDVPEDADSREYIVIKGLEEGKKYSIVETEAPHGYLTSDEISFEFSDGMNIHIQNRIPEILTTATDNETEDHISMAGENVRFTDHVSYNKLVLGREYTLKGTLVYAGDEFISENESAVINNGEPVTAYTTFIPEEEKGIQNVEFTFDGSDTAGKDIVIFEELISDDVTVISHCDPNNKNQTISMPEIKTKAKIKGKEIIDEITYNNLISGKRYAARGWLVDTKTGKKIEGSDGFNTFYINDGEEGGSIEVTLKADMSILAGKKVTVFEELYLVNEEIDADTGIPKVTSEVKVAEHKDLKDLDQTVEIPKRSSPKTGDISGGLIGLMYTSMLISICSIILIIKKRRT